MGDLESAVRSEWKNRETINEAHPLLVLGRTLDAGLGELPLVRYFWQSGRMGYPTLIFQYKDIAVRVTDQYELVPDGPHGVRETKVAGAYVTVYGPREDATTVVAEYGSWSWWAWGGEPDDAKWTRLDEVVAYIKEAAGQPVEPPPPASSCVIS
jgi:hypothetical protein